MIARRPTLARPLNTGVVLVGRQGRDMAHSRGLERIRSFTAGRDDEVCNRVLLHAFVQRVFAAGGGACLFTPIAKSFAQSAAENGTREAGTQRVHT